ncbi:hypothetical protein DL766_007626 [Monosporascus sp. MC13-8B]|uniref:WSC domain-containing protein n=1 Tax=Monosporascus cannonballus TaxID=155416 RepID=A0ABY0HFQ9_9PEZI|nr:hypothetical protein DL762_003191 [Monosporascus cannonballus]RYO98259.1 hypothetical protein DL763_002359 [Monosporascus cannonballus]RYP22809.1 hypothetical protein DL766_007626 [Monosporascus sp. MC13-8B]
MNMSTSTPTAVPGFPGICELDCDSHFQSAGIVGEVQKCREKCAMNCSGMYGDAGSIVKKQILPSPTPSFIMPPATAYCFSPRRAEEANGPIGALICFDTYLATRPEIPHVAGTAVTN